MCEILRFEQVSYSYEKGRKALDNVSVSIHIGEKLAVMGKNGAGKSTFFLLANGVLKPESGQIFFQGSTAGRSPEKLSILRKGVGLVFQEPDVQIIAGSVEEEISFGPMNLRLPKQEVRRLVDAAVESFDLEAFRERAPQHLSGGEKKRVTLADVVAMQPRVLLLDEPAASLDPANARLMEQNLSRLSEKGLTLVAATHDVDFAWRWASRLLLFHNGQIVADCAPEEAFADQSLLAACGLEQPLLYQVGQILKLPRPLRSIKELEQEISI